MLPELECKTRLLKTGQISDTGQGPMYVELTGRLLHEDKLSYNYEILWKFLREENQSVVLPCGPSLPRVSAVEQRITPGACQRVNSKRYFPV